VTDGLGPVARRVPLILAACAGILALVLPPPPAAADGGLPPRQRQAVGAGDLSVRITSIAPAIPEPGDTLVIRGTITNVSAGAVTDVSAVLRVSTTVLPSRGEIPEILSGAGERVGRPAVGAAASDQVTDMLGPGATADFALQADVDDLGLGAAGVYMTGAEARGSTGGAVVRQDVDRTFLPWWPDGTQAEPLALTTLWPLAEAPVRDATGTLVSDAPAVAMSPEGRLSNILAAQRAAPGAMTLVLDPETVEAAVAMADGYAVRTEDGIESGTRTAEVTAWLADLRRAVADPAAEVISTLYAIPDLVAARRGRLVGTLMRQREAIDEGTQEALGRALPSDIALLADGTSDAGTLSRLARWDVRVAVLSDSGVVQTRPSYFTPSGNVLLATDSGDLPVLVTDSGLDAALAMPLSDESDRTAARQRLLAETLVTIIELPETPRLLVASTDPAWSPPAAGARMIAEVLAGTPWIEPTSVAAALAREPSSVPRELADYTDEQQARELSGQHVGQVRDQFRAVAEYSEVLSDPADLPVAAGTAPTRGMASWFRADRIAGALLADTVSAELATALASVRVVSSGSISVSGASGTIPVTVENLGPAQVTVGLTMSSEPPQLFTADAIEPFPIDPGQRTSLEVRAQVAAAGPIPVTVQLTTAAGAPFGRSAELIVASSAYANAARILVRAALVALGLAVAVHGVRRARRARRARRTTEGADMLDDPTGVTRG
jgi:hypothetical protein